MKKLFILILLLVILVGCEPIGGGIGYQYLGTSKRVIVICDENNNYTTTVITKCSTITVRGKIDINKSWFFVWLNIEKRKLRVRRNGQMAEYFVLMYYDE